MKKLLAALAAVGVTLGSMGAYADNWTVDVSVEEMKYWMQNSGGINADYIMKGDVGVTDPSGLRRSCDYTIAQQYVWLENCSHATETVGQVLKKFPEIEARVKHTFMNRDDFNSIGQYMLQEVFKDHNITGNQDIFELRYVEYYRRATLANMTRSKDLINTDGNITYKPYGLLSNVLMADFHTDTRADLETILGNGFSTTDPGNTSPGFTISGTDIVYEEGFENLPALARLVFTKGRINSNNPDGTQQATPTRDNYEMFYESFYDFND